MSTEVKKEMTKEEALALREQIKSRIVQVLGTGRMNARMEQIMAALPADKRGCFVRDRGEDIINYQALGYEIETGLKIEGLPASADGRIRVGDVILMTTSKERFELIREVEVEMVQKKLDLQKSQYLESAESNRSAGIAPFAGVHNL